MIESSADSIHILYPDGSSAVFDSSELRTRLIRALSEAGLEDLTIAEEISLAVEFTLRGALHEAGIDSVSSFQLDQAVSKSLEDAGYALAAEKFLSATSAPSAVEKIAPEELASFFRLTLSLGETEAVLLGEKTAEALKKLGLSRCSRQFALALAREIRTLAAEEMLKKREMHVPCGKKRILPGAETLVARLEEPCKELFCNGILKLNECTALFPSVRVEIFLEKALALLPERPQQNAPVTELVLAPVLGRCAACVDRIYEELEKTVEKESLPAGKLPLLVTFSDMGSFAEKFLLAGNAEGSPEKCARNLGAYFRAMLKNAPFRIRYGK